MKKVLAVFARAVPMVRIWPPNPQRMPVRILRINWPAPGSIRWN